MVVWFEGFGSIWFQHVGVSELLVPKMFGVLCILGFGISCSRVCVLRFLGSASSVLGLGCVGGQGVLKVCFLVFSLSDVLFTTSCTFNAVNNASCVAC